jgi:hypothetical protein
MRAYQKSASIARLKSLRKTPSTLLLQASSSLGENKEISLSHAKILRQEHSATETYALPVTIPSSLDKHRKSETLTFLLHDREISLNPCRNSSKYFRKYSKTTKSQKPQEATAPHGLRHENAMQEGKTLAETPRTDELLVSSDRETEREEAPRARNPAAENSESRNHGT